MALTQVDSGLIESGAALENIGAGNITSTYLASGAALTNIGTGNITTTYIANAAVTPAKLSQKLTLGTAVASTSGTNIDFTGIPSWVERITVMFAGVSTNGTSIIQIQLGDSGGIETTGYVGAASYLDNAASADTGSYTSGIALSRINTAASTWNGSVVITNLNSNIWVANGLTANPEIPRTNPTAASKTLSDVLDRVRITTVNGTDTFDAGTINILYE